MNRYSLRASYIVPIMLLTLSHSLHAQCGPGDASGRFDGSAISSQAGKLDVSLNLMCENGAYTGALNTPIGVFTVSSGSFSGNTLKLELSANGSTIRLDANVSGSSINGTFATTDDKGPLALHRVGDATPVNQPSGLTPMQWHEDLAFLVKQLTTLHPDAYANTPKLKFDATVSELDKKLDHLNPDEIYVGFDQITNLIGDGHTYVDFPPNRANLPLDITRFGSDERIDAVAAGYQQALGARVVAIGNMPVAKAEDLVRTVTPIAETDGLRSLRTDVFLSTGMMLHGLDITPARDAAMFVLVGADGTQFSMEFKQLAPGENVHWLYASSPLPLSQKAVDANAPCTYLHPERTLYCNIKMILQLEKASQQMLDQIAKEHPDKVVIDLRQNGGGDYNLGLQYLIRPLQQDKNVNRKGHLFVLIGPNTFSAAMSNASQFRTTTNATLVGQPIGERPNTFQEPREFTLPNSRFVVRYSTRFYKFATDGENIIRPDKQIEQSWAHFRVGQDDALDWIIHQR